MFIIADHQDITRLGLTYVIERMSASAVQIAGNKEQLIECLKQAPDGVVVCDYTQFDFTGPEELIIIVDRFSSSHWLLFSEELSTDFVRMVTASSARIGILLKSCMQEEIEQLKNAINGLADTKLNSVGVLEKLLQLDYEVIERTEVTGQETRVIQNRNERRWMDKIETTLSLLKKITNDNYECNRISIKTVQPVGDTTEIKKSSWSDWLDFANNQKEIIGNKDYESNISETRVILRALRDEVDKLEKRVSYFESAINAYEKELSTDEESESSLPEDLVEYQRKTKHELEQYKALVTEAENIEKIFVGAENIYSADIHENVSKHFLNDAFECCADYYVNVKLISYYAEKSSKDLKKILSIVQSLKTKKEEWWESIKKVNDGVTRAEFENDYKSMTEMYKEEEIEDLANEFLQGKLKKPQADKIKQAIDGITFFGKRVIKYSIDFTLSYEENVQSETEKKEDEVFLPSERENLSVSPAKKEKMVAFCKPSHGIEYRDVYAYVYAKAEPKNGQIDDCYKLADEIVHSGDSKYTVPSVFLSGELPNNLGSHSESVFRSATTLKEIEEMGYVDGYKDNPETYLGNEPKREETLREFLEEIKKVQEAKEKKEKFFFVLMELAPAEQNATKTDDQNKQEENLNKSIEADKTLTKKPAKDGENEQPEVATIKTGIDDYIKGKADKGKGMNKANLSNMQGTSVPKTKDSKKDGYEDEGKKASDSVSNGKSILSDLLSIGEKIAQNAYLEEYFTEMFSCDTDRIKQGEVKNLLGVAYDPSNAWYGKEVEYIIWGNANLDNNVTYMYQSIFAIRFVLNTIYAFTAADIQSFALQLATVIAGWTIFGVPLVQAAITIGLALAESGLDIKDLSEGKDVVIYKSVHTFKCSPTNLVKTVATEIVDPIVEEAKDAISDKFHEWTDNLSGTIDDNIDTLNGYVDKMVTKPIDGMVDQVTDFICIPINNALQKYTSRVQTLDGFTKESIGVSIDSTIAMIRETAENQSPSVMKDAELVAIDYLEKNIVSGLKNELYGLVNGTNPLDLSKVQDIVKSKIKNDTAFLEKIKSSFTSMTSEMATEIKKDLGELKDQGVEAFDEFIDKKAGELSGRISGAITKEAGKWVENNKDITTSSGGLNLTLNYKEYCKIFTFVAIIGNENEMLRRTAVLIQLNVNKKKGSNGGNFEIKTAYTLFRLQSKVTMKTILPWGVEAKVEDETGTDSWNLSLDKMGESEMTIDYTGVCGY